MIKNYSFPSFKAIRIFTIKNILPFVLIFSLWELSIRLDIITTKFIPLPSEILERLSQLVINKSIFNNLLSSLRRLLLGYLLATIIGVLLGLIIGTHKKVRNTISPLISLLMSVPTIAWVPILLLIFGLGDFTVVITIFLGGFFPIVSYTIRGVELIDRKLVLVAEILKVSGMNKLIKVILPGASVSIISGLRLGIGYSWRALVGGEMLAALIHYGIGKMIYYARFWNDIPSMFVGLFLISTFSLFFEVCVFDPIEDSSIIKWGMITKLGSK